MFYNVPSEQLFHIDLGNIMTHSFIQRECALLKYVENRNAVDLNRTDMDFSIYLGDVEERRTRISIIQELFKRKQELLSAFQNGRDIWKNRRAFQ